MALDYYALAEQLAAALQSRGQAEAAQDLRDIVAGGNSSSEFLMGLRWRLRKLLAEATMLEDEDRTAAQTLLEALSRAL